MCVLSLICAGYYASTIAKTPRPVTSQFDSAGGMQVPYWPFTLIRYAHQHITQGIAVDVAAADDDCRLLAIIWDYF